MKKLIFAAAVVIIACNDDASQQPLNAVEVEPRCTEHNLTFEDVSCIPGPDCRYGTYATDWLKGACIKAKLGSGRDCDSYRSGYVLTITECEE